MGKRLIIPGADFSANAIEREPIPVPVEFTLQNGYASAYPPDTINADQGASVSKRVRTGELYGAYTVKTKSGYVIRAIASYGASIDPISEGNNITTDAMAVSDVQGLTEYTFSSSDKYSIVTFCKEDAGAEISASEDIVDYIIRPLE